MSKEFDSFTYMLLGKGNDHYVGHAARQNVKGGPGADTITGGRSVDALNGGAGNDRLTSVGVGDFVEAGGGRDRYRLSSGSNIVFVDDGDDKVTGFQGDQDFLIFSDIGKANVEFVDNKSDRLEMMNQKRVNIVDDRDLLFYRDTESRDSKSRDLIFCELKFNSLQGPLDSSNTLRVNDIAYSSLPSWFFSDPA